MVDWNDLRYFLAVARTGSTLAAGKLLRVSQTTAARRVLALEQALGLSLFDRQQSGYAITEAGLALLAQAEAVEKAAESFADGAAALNRTVSGTVRLTTTEIYAISILPPILRDLHEVHPAIRIEVDASDEVRDIAGGAADVALRNSNGLTEAGLVCRRVAANPWTVYCSRPYAAQNGLPQSLAQLQQHPLIGGGGPSVWPLYRGWLARHGLEGAVTMHHNSISGLLAAVRAGSGLAVLPSYVAERDPDLIQCLPPSPKDKGALWLVTSEGLRHAPRIRVVLDFLAEQLRRPPVAAISA